MVELLVEMMNFILRMASGNTMLGDSSALSQSIATYNQSAYDFVMKANELVVRPVAALVLAIIVCLEYVRLSTSSQGDHSLGVKMIALASIKVALMIIMILNVDKILLGLNAIGQSITTGTSKLVRTTKPAANQDFKEQLDPIFGALWMPSKIGMLVLLIIPLLLSVAAVVVLKIMIIFRFMELYILSAAATLPLVFMAHPETKSIAIGYLRKYGAAVLHSVVIVLIIGLYSYWQNSASGIDAILASLQKDSIFTFLINNMGELIIAPVILIGLLIKSAGFARALMGE